MIVARIQFFKLKILISGYESGLKRPNSFRKSTRSDLVQKISEVLVLASPSVRRRRGPPRPAEACYK